MQIAILVILIILGLAVQYVVIKAAVVYGTQETYNNIDKYNFSQTRRAVKEGIIEALKEGDNAFMKELGSVIRDAVKSAADEGNVSVSIND